MAVYVDACTRKAPKGRAAKYGEWWCHMMADSIAELDYFAKKLGLKVHDRHGDHYDLTPTIRLQAVKMGALEVTTADLLKIRQHFRRSK